MTERARRLIGNNAKKIPKAEASGNLLEVTTRFELVDEGFADPCLTTWPRHRIGSDEYHSNGAADEARTRYLHLGKVALYQMSYGRISGAFIPAPSRAILANFGVPAKACGARFCGEKEKIWYSSQKSCLQDFPMNDRIFDVVPPIGIEPMTRGFSVPCSTD